MDPSFWAEFFTSFRDPIFYVKIGLLLVTYPIWGPIVRALYQELKLALRPEGGVFGNERPGPIGARPRGLDPFLNIPHGARRAHEARSGRAALVEVRRRGF